MRGTRRRQVLHALPYDQLGYEQLGCAVLIWNASGRLTYANSAAKEVLGLEPALGSNLATGGEWHLCDAGGELLAPESLPSVKALKTGRPQHQFTLGLTNNGEPYKWLQVNALPVKDRDGSVREVITTAMDVTTLKHAEPALQTAERSRDGVESAHDALSLREAAQQIGQLTADAIYTVDQDGVVWSWNHGAERLFGWTRHDVVGKFHAFVPPELLNAATADIQRILYEGLTLTKETVRLSKDGRRIDVLGSWSRVVLEDGRLGVLCILKDITDHKAAERQLEDQTRFLALLRERERIAMDLHDGVIQSLYGVALSLGALRRKSSRADSAVLDHAISQLTESIQGIRDYIYELRTGVSEEADLEAALRAKADDVARQAGVTPHISIQTDLGHLSPETAHHVLYIAHEALSNVARHARASDVAIHVVPWGAGTMLTIVDNGRGFDPERKGRRLGDGLRNMRERAGLLGAKVTVDSQPGTGTTVKVLLP